MMWFILRAVRTMATSGNGPRPPTFQMQQLCLRKDLFIFAYAK